MLSRLPPALTLWTPNDAASAPVECYSHCLERMPSVQYSAGKEVAPDRLRIMLVQPSSPSLNALNTSQFRAWFCTVTADAGSPARLP